MILFVGVSVLVLLLAYFCNTAASEQPERLRSGMTRQHALNLWLCGGIYVILSALSVCRIASGNDYWVYTSMFNLIAQGRHVSSEFGFNALVRMMQYFFGTEGYSYLPIFGLFSLLTIYFFYAPYMSRVTGSWAPCSCF